jgi:hypothetical protein
MFFRNSESSESEANFFQHPCQRYFCQFKRKNVDRLTEVSRSPMGMNYGIR